MWFVFRKYIFGPKLKQNESEKDLIETLTNCIHPQRWGCVSDIRFVNVKGSAHMQFVNHSQPTWRRHDAAATTLFAKRHFLPRRCFDVLAAFVFQWLWFMVRPEKAKKSISDVTTIKCEWILMKHLIFIPDYTSNPDYN